MFIKSFSYSASNYIRGLGLRDGVAPPAFKLPFEKSIWPIFSSTDPPIDMHIDSINHIQLNFQSAIKEEIRFFYKDILGFSESNAESKKNMLLFKIGAQHLSFSPVNERLGTSLAQHLAFNVSDLQELKKKFEALDLSFIESYHTAHAKNLYIKDPAGNQLEFLEPQPLETHA
mgnify:CR=1 FL=1